MMAGVPDLDLQDKAMSCTIKQFREQCDEALSARDKQLLFYFYLRHDCMNIVRLLRNPEAEVDDLGNFTREQYSDMITSATELNFNVHRYPAFMSEYIRAYAYNKDKANYFAEDDMMGHYLEYAIACPNRMMSK